MQDISLVHITLVRYILSEYFSSILFCYYIMFLCIYKSAYNGLHLEYVLRENFDLIKQKIYSIRHVFCYSCYIFEYYITPLFIFLDICKAEYITLKVSPNRKCISFNRRKSISLTATCISGSRLLPMFRLHSIDR